MSSSIWCPCNLSTKSLSPLCDVCREPSVRNVRLQSSSLVHLLILFGYLSLTAILKVSFLCLSCIWYDYTKNRSVVQYIDDNTTGLETHLLKWSLYNGTFQWILSWSFHNRQSCWNTNNRLLHKPVKYSLSHTDRLLLKKSFLFHKITHIYLFHHISTISGFLFI